MKRSLLRLDRRATRALALDSICMMLFLVSVTSFFTARTISAFCSVMRVLVLRLQSRGSMCGILESAFVVGLSSLRCLFGVLNAEPQSWR